MSLPPEPARPVSDLTAFRLGEWTVRQAEGMLCSDRKSVRLEPRIMDVLLYLADRPGRVVSKEELLEAVWGGAFVEEGVLAQAVHSLRKALGDDAHQPRYVQTIPKRGYRLLAPVVPEETAAGALWEEPLRIPRNSAERRQVTVLRCGLGGQSLDPEEILQDLPALDHLVAEVVARYEGHLSSNGAQGWLAYFGYPLAHEDDASRAVRAGLEIAARSDQISSQTGAPALRVGIHTGPMVITPAGSSAREELPLGQAPEVASLVQSLAEPGAVLVSPATQRLVRRSFQFEELDPVPLPGASQPVRSYRVISETGAHGHVDIGASRTPLVGRQQEIGLLLERWALAREGNGQVVLLAGEAGMGKSRLIRELRQRVEGDGPGWLEVHGSPYHRNSALHPILQGLHRWIGADGPDSPGLRLERLEAVVSRHGLPLAQTVPPLAALLSLPAEERYPLPAMSPEMQHKRTLEALVALLLARAERQPLLLVVEDLHWADPSTLELLGLLIHEAAAAPILLLLTFRPEFVPPWESWSFQMRLTLGPLTREQAGLMIERLTEDKSLDASIEEQIAARTDGVPLFIEELTKMILESDLVSGSGRQGAAAAGGLELEVPDTLEGWLRARLDRLGSAGQVAQLASVLGREFSDELLRAVSPWSEAGLQRELDRLLEAEILHRRGRPPRHRYLFKHALLQDAAYASLLRSDRQAHHRRIAEVLAERFPELAESQPELLAHHYTEAGLPGRAVPLWQAAGNRAIRGGVFSEASGHLTRALSLLKTLPDDARRKEVEIALLVSLGVAEGAKRHSAAEPVHELYTRAWELCSGLGPTPQLFPVLHGLCIHFLTRGDLERGRAAGAQALQLAESERDPYLLQAAHVGMGFIELLAADFLLARSHLEDAVSQAAGLPPCPLILLGGGDLAVGSFSILSWALWFLGYPDQALTRSGEALALVRPGMPQASALAGFFASELRSWRGEAENALKHADDALAAALEEGIWTWQVSARIARGQALLAQGEVERSASELRPILGRPVSGRALIWLPMRLLVWAECCRRLGDLTESMSALDLALDLSSSTGQHFVDAELHRLKGELLALQGASAAEVEDRLREALEIARRQSARSLELRSAISLARLWAGQGTKEKARDLLAGVYGWFTEGFDTRDLREARALLDELI